MINASNEKLQEHKKGKSDMKIFLVLLIQIIGNNTKYCFVTIIQTLPPIQNHLIRSLQLLL